jgi:hypothetical protein
MADVIRDLVAGVGLVIGGIGTFLLGALQADITYGIAEYIISTLNGTGSIKGSLNAVKSAGTAIQGIFALIGIVFTVAGAYLVVQAVRGMTARET